MDNKKIYLADKEMNELFKKYSFPIIKPCITDVQKEKAIGISKILWLLLVTGTDSEENIYKAMKSLVNHHDEIISLGALYYHKMKKALTEKEIKTLKKYYENLENLNSLKNWNETTFAKKLH